MKKVILCSLLAAMLAFTACGKTEVPDAEATDGTLSAEVTTTVADTTKATEATTAEEVTEATTEASEVTEAPATETPKTEATEATTTKPPYPGYKELRAYNGMTQDEMKAHGYTANLPSEIIFAVDGGKSVEITKDITGPEIAKALGVKKLNANTNPEWVLLRPDDIEHALIVNDGMCTVTAFSEDFVFSLLGITYSTTEEDVLKTFGAPDMLSTGTMNDLNTDVFQWEDVEIGGTKFNLSVMFCWNDSTPIYAYYASISFK